MWQTRHELEFYNLLCLADSSWWLAFSPNILTLTAVWSMYVLSYAWNVGRRYIYW